MTGYPISSYSELKHAVNEYGEVHAPHEELEYEVEIRKGQAVWNDDQETVSIKVHGDIVRTFAFDRMVAPYCPQEYKHDD